MQSKARTEWDKMDDEILRTLRLYGVLSTREIKDFTPWSMSTIWTRLNYLERWGSVYRKRSYRNNTRWESI
jgi:DNA-binding HxlR family transcriptional regulator